MKTADQIIEHITEYIVHIYLRPLMYASDAYHLDLLLGAYHELWSFSSETLEDFRAIRSADDTEPMNTLNEGFAEVYRKMNPAASEQEIAFHVVDKWLQISRQLGMHLPFNKFVADYKRLRDAAGPNGPFNVKLFDVVSNE